MKSPEGMLYIFFQNGVDNDSNVTVKSPIRANYHKPQENEMFVCGYQNRFLNK